MRRLRLTRPVAPLPSGSHQITVTIRDRAGQTASSSVRIHIDEFEPPVLLPPGVNPETGEVQLSVMTEPGVEVVLESSPDT